MLEQTDLNAIAALITKSESMILDKMDRFQTNLEKKKEKAEQNPGELKNYYRIIKLGNDNTALLLQIISDPEKDVEELKGKTA